MELSSTVQVSALAPGWSAMAAEPKFRLQCLSPVLDSTLGQKALSPLTQLSPTLHEVAVVSNSIEQMPEKE